MSLSRYPATVPPVWRVDNGGGPLLAAPRLVSVTYSDDRFVAETDDLVARIGQTSWWRALGEYGVGSVSSTASIHLPTKAPVAIDDADIKTWLADSLAKDPASWGDPAGSLYVIGYPPSTKITIAAAGVTACTEVGAYHAEAPLADGRSVAYAVVPDCQNGFSGLSGLVERTADASHEIAEAVTDPFIVTQPAWHDIDAADQVRGLQGAEIGDLCVDMITGHAPLWQLPELPYRVQRLWSNAAAASGKNPCIPVPDGEVYFNAAPELPSLITLRDSIGTFTSHGIHIAQGDSATVTLDLFSDGPTDGPWQVDAIDLATLVHSTPHLQFSFDKTSGQNGDRIQMTIHVLITNTSQEGEVFWVRSTLGDVMHDWVGVVGG